MPEYFTVKSGSVGGGSLACVICLMYIFSPLEAAAALARSSTEMLEADEKFFCNSCRCLQEAQKRMKIATLPRVLCLHLKRFKYIEQLDRWRHHFSTC